MAEIGAMTALYRVLGEIKERRRLLHRQTVVIDICHEDPVYEICEQIVRDEIHRVQEAT